MKCICSRLRYRAAITGLGLAVVALAATPAAWAHIDPPGATLAGVGGSLGVFTDATCSQALTGPVLECATIYVQTSLQWQSNPPGNAAFEAGFWRLTAAPGGVNPALIQNLGAVPCIGGTLDDPNSIANNGRGLCFEAAEVLPSDCIPYAITAADAAAGFVTIQALYGDANPLSADTAFSHRSEGDNPGASATSTESVVVNLCNAPEEECREAERCDPALNDGLGACVQDDKADSTTCTDDSLDCYIAGCEEGVCVQDHTPVAASTPCDEVAGTECADPGCDGAGTCVATHIPKADSTTCTDDSLDCSIAGCESGVCVQDHTPVAASTPCDEVAGTECADPGCDGAGTCVATHIPKADSTDCTDTGEDCWDAGCESGACVQEHTPVAASTPCTDTGDECFDAGCDGAGICNQEHTEICVPDLACRTVGFWGARGGSEKGGFNFTQAAIDAAGGQLDVCGEAITRSNSDVLDLGDLGHALEAICVNNRQGPQIQLYRQMTAAALNCAASAGTDDCTGIIPLDGVTWAQCNTACIAGDLADPTVVRSCKNQFDCFNNGGQFVGGQCYEGICVELLRGLGDLNDFMLCNSPADCSGGDDDDDDGGLYECVPIPGNCHDQDFCDGPMVFPPDSDLCYSHKRNSSPRACWAASRNDCTIVECLP